MGQKAPFVCYSYFIVICESHGTFCACLCSPAHTIITFLTSSQTTDWTELIIIGCVRKIENELSLVAIEMRLDYLPRTDHIQSNIQRASSSYWNK